MLRKLFAALLCAALVCSFTLAEDAGAPNATPAVDRPLREIIDTSAESASEPVETKPYVPETLDRVIVGADERITVNEPGVYPYSAIAYMVVQARCGCDWVCSGFMVGPRGLITGAHCLVCTTHHQSAERITFYFGYKSSRNYLYKYNGSTQYWYGTDFSDNPWDDNEWDYGYVLLDERVGDRTGWLGVSTLSDSDLTTKYLTVAGYRDGTLKYDCGFADVVSANVISYTADTLPGNSGGPVFFYTADDIYATAINVASSDTLQKNYARRINNWLFDDMRSNGLFD